MSPTGLRANSRRCRTCVKGSSTETLVVAFASASPASAMHRSAALNRCPDGRLDRLQRPTLRRRTEEGEGPDIVRAFGRQFGPGAGWLNIRTRGALAIVGEATSMSRTAASCCPFRRQPWRPTGIVAGRPSVARFLLATRTLDVVSLSRPGQGTCGRDLDPFCLGRKCRRHLGRGGGGVVPVVEILRVADVADGDAVQAPVGAREIVREGAVAPSRVGWVDPTLPIPRRPDPIDVGVMQEEDRIAWRQHGGHVAGDRIVDSVVRGRFQHTHDSLLALAFGRPN